MYDAGMDLMKSAFVAQRFMATPPSRTMAM
jgi:hypothetical protein